MDEIDVTDEIEPLLPWFVYISDSRRGEEGIWAIMVMDPLMHSWLISFD